MRHFILSAIFALLAAGANAQSASLVANTTKCLPTGGTIVLTATVTYAVAPNALGWKIEIPEGWNYLGGDGEPEVRPTPGRIRTLEWAYISAPASRAEFRTTLAYPAGTTGAQVVAATVIFRTTDKQTLSPAPIQVQGAQVEGPDDGGPVGDHEHIWQSYDANNPLWTLGAWTAWGPDPASWQSSHYTTESTTWTQYRSREKRRTVDVWWRCTAAGHSGGDRDVADRQESQVETETRSLVIWGVRNSDGTSTPSRIVDFSVRSCVGNGNETLIVGFVIGGTGTQDLLLRAIGPSLVTQGVPSAITDPMLTLYHGDRPIAGNDNWGGGPAVTELCRELGATPVGADSKDAMLVEQLSVGAYTAHAGSVDDSAGVALVELYDAAKEGPTCLQNVSARAVAGTGDDTLIAGFVIAGTAPKRVLIRAVGPSLSRAGVTGIVADPTLTLFRGQTPLASNDNWDGAPELATTMTRIGASELDSPTDAVLLITLPPGIYTAHVGSADGHPGVALVEVYDAD